jgi:hypothetical protein
MHTHRPICNTYCFSTTTMVSWTRLNVTLCLHCLSCLYSVPETILMTEGRMLDSPAADYKVACCKSPCSEARHTFHPFYRSARNCSWQPPAVVLNPHTPDTIWLPQPLIYSFINSFPALLHSVAWYFISFCICFVSQYLQHPVLRPPISGWHRGHDVSCFRTDLLKGLPGRRYSSVVTSF